MDFGYGDREFHYTWWPHNDDKFHAQEFKAELQALVGTLREGGPLETCPPWAPTAEKTTGPSRKMDGVPVTLRKQSTTEPTSAVPYPWGTYTAIAGHDPVRQPWNVGQVIFISVE